MNWDETELLLLSILTSSNIRPFKYMFLLIYKFSLKILSPYIFKKLSEFNKFKLPSIFTFFFTPNPPSMINAPVFEL